MKQCMNFRMSHKDSENKIFESGIYWVIHDNSQTPKYAQVRCSNFSIQIWMTKNRKKSQTWIEGDSWKLRCLKTQKFSLTPICPKWYWWCFRNPANQDLSKKNRLPTCTASPDSLGKDTINIRQQLRQILLKQVILQYLHIDLAKIHRTKKVKSLPLNN